MMSLYLVTTAIIGFISSARILHLQLMNLIRQMTCLSYGYAGSVKTKTTPLRAVFLMPPLRPKTASARCVRKPKTLSATLPQLTFRSHLARGLKTDTLNFQNSKSLMLTASQLKINVNCQSVKNKIPELHTLLDTEKPDILIGTESWLTPDIQNSEIIPPDLGYSIFREDRTSSIGGGVFILVIYIS